MGTTSKITDLRQVLNSGNLSDMDAVLKKIKLGNMLSAIKIVVAGLTAAAAIDITTAAVKAAATISGITLATGENLPAIGAFLALRVTASGTAASVGNYILGDSTSTLLVPPGGANVAVGVARISDDGKTITFPNTITAFTLMYMPRPDVALTTEFNISGVG